MRTALKKDVGGELTYLPPAPGRPTGAYVSVVTPNGAELIAETAATVDPVNTTTTADAKRSDDTLTLASTADLVVDRRYSLLSSTGRHERVRIAEVDGLVVTLHEGLVYDHDSGAELFGSELSLDVTGSVVDTLGEGYEARWRYTQSGREIRVQTRFDVTFSVWPAVLLHPDEFRQYVSSRSRRTHQQSDRPADWVDRIESATADVLLDIRDAGRDPNRFRTFSEFKVVIAERVLLNGVENEGKFLPSTYKDDSSRYLEEVRRPRYQSALSKALKLTRDYDDDQDGVVSRTEADDDHGTDGRWSL